MQFFKYRNSDKEVGIQVGYLLINTAGNLVTGSYRIANIITFG